MIELAVEAIYRTALGACYQADALDILKQLDDNSVSLVLTSPPYPLRRRKAYGNVADSQYLEWFWPFAEEVWRVLKPDGSFVLELGGTWNRGSGTRSLYQYELILKLCQRFHLAQEFYSHNPSKLPTPAEWVTIKRTRVKDSVSMVWWLSKTVNPQADNRRVLRPYSRSMHRLLRDGYQTATRPSQHAISPHFRRDNGGAIPGNMIEAPNTHSQDRYLRRCREAGLQIHPARFPPALPDFFIRFLTRPGELVLDPFAGSNMTGYLAEKLERQWLSIEINAEYVAGSRLRFVEEEGEPTTLLLSARSDDAAG